jgi:mono/diheme cytochrome c family protein
MDVKMLSTMARIAVLAAGLAVAGQAWAAGDAVQGKATAERWCATCHVVAAGGRGADVAPNFATIAKQRNDEYLRGFLTRPHPPMPRFELSRPDIDDLVAYIGTQR